MEASTQLPEKLEEALRRGVLNRMPLTILSVSQSTTSRLEFPVPQRKTVNRETHSLFG